MNKSRATNVNSKKITFKMTTLCSNERERVGVLRASSSTWLQRTNGAKKMRKSYNESGGSRDEPLQDDLELQHIATIQHKHKEKIFSF